MRDDSQYRLWDIIEVPADRSSRDQRPESLKIDPDSLRRVGHIPTDSHGWAARRELMERSLDWHYAGMAELRAANRSRKTSIGLVVPGAVEDVELAEKPADERDSFLAKCEELKLRKESDMFDPLYLTLDYLPYEIFLHWRCGERCETCGRRPHRMKVLDWGLLQLARRQGWSAAAAKLRNISDGRRHDFRLFLGNFAQHPATFGIIALWYPSLQEQQSLF